MIDLEKMAADVLLARKALAELEPAWLLLEYDPTKRTDEEVGERFAKAAIACGRVAAAHLFRAEWYYAEPEWFDHRLHLLDPETHFNDFWTASADNVISILPLGGRLLDLCSGDGFYDYWFYRYRASLILSIERDPEVLQFAIKHHSHPNISYVHGDILTAEVQSGSFDTVVIRGAIEHFTRENQQRIFKKAWDALKPGGYFCGDTPAKRGEEIKALEAHEFEWRDEAEMRRELSGVFSNIQTRTLVSTYRTTLLWQCQK